MSILAVIVYVLVGAAGVLAAIDAFLTLRGGRRPVTIAVAVVSLALLLALVTTPFHGSVVLIAALTAVLLIALIIEIVTSGAGRRRALTITAAVVALLALLSLWPIVGLTVT